MTKTYLFTSKGVQKDVSLDDWRSLAPDECKLLWVDVRSATPEEVNDLARRFGLHAVAVESCLDGYRRPHLYEFSDHFYVNLTVLKPGPNRVQGEHGVKASELHLFAGGDFIITITADKESEAVDKALAVYLDSPAACSRGPMYAVYLLTEDLVETYYPLVEKLDDEADKLESKMLDKADKKSLSKLFALKRRGFELRKLLGPQRDVLTELARRDFPFIEGENRIYFQDIYNRMIRIFDMMDTIREILSGNLDIYLSTVSNRLNEVMKVLTVVATVLMTLSFITGFWGMNFVSLPWLQSPNSVRNMLISMGVITAGMLWWFRRKGWM
ncbi:MAG: magnesium/cobalt transporter CorA [Actinobacteria bacterium]|nr:magnesium/cobalt transporter CorA [Actinomycetota bacterium]